MMTSKSKLCDEVCQRLVLYCPVDLTDTTELGMEVVAGIVQPLAESTQSDSKADQTKNSKEGAKQTKLLVEKL